MSAFALASNPFALMMEPQRVQEAMENSRSLRSLRGQEFHPLDKPAKVTDADLAEFDAAIDRLKLRLPSQLDNRRSSRNGGVYIR